MKEKSLRAFVKYYRYVAVCAFLLMFVHLVLLMHGYSLHIASALTSLSAVPWFTALWLSKCLGFCLAHKSCLMYVLVMSVCIRFQESGAGFGDYLQLARVIMLVIGIAIMFWLIKRRVCQKRTKN